MMWAWLPAAALLACAVSAEKTDYRLPRSVVPERYRLYLVPFHPDATRFSGNVTITVTAVEATRNITVHASSLQVKLVQVKTVSAPVRKVTVIGTDNSSDSRHFFVLRLDKRLQRGARYNVVFQFVGELRDSLYGFYRRVYDDTGGTRMLAATQFEATYARAAFPCFDEPSFKATFQINIARATIMTALSNMPLKSTSLPDPGLDGRVWDMFAESPPMSTYLVAAVVGELQPVATSMSRLTLWVRPGVSELAAFSASYSPRVLQALEDYTGLQYCLPKLYQVAIPTFSVTMENWGLVLYMESNLLISSEWSTEANKQEVAIVVAHELAHQWFGNLVTADWWQYTWLNEGLAHYFAYLLLDQLEPSWRIMDQFVVTHMQPMLVADASGTTDALNSVCSSPTEVAHKFGLVSYNKGASVTRMMEHALTEETFRKGIGSYLTSRQLATARPRQLYDALQAQATTDGRLRDVGVPLWKLFDGWASQPGYPLLAVNRSYSDGGVLVSQSRFFLNASKTSNERWCIPLTWTSKTNSPTGFKFTSPTAWLLDNQSRILLPSIVSRKDWIIFNIQESGFYRVNYDKQNWKLLTEQLNSDGYQDIHVLNRAQLLDDVFNLARAGHLDYGVSFNLSRYLTRETDPIPWIAAFSSFSFINQMLAGSESLDAFQGYVLGLIPSIYDSVGFDEPEEGSHFASVTRSQVLAWACSLGHKGCVQTATDMFAAWRNSAEPDFDNTIHPNLKDVVYCTAIANGGVEEWDFLMSWYADGNAPVDSHTIIEALGCSKNISVLNRYLQMSVNENSNIQILHLADVFSSVYNNQHGIDAALNFLIENFTNMTKRYGGMNTLARKISGLAMRLTTEQQIEKLENFFEANKIQVLSGAVTRESVMASLRTNLNWKNCYYHTIERWLAINNAQITYDIPNYTDTFLSWIFYTILVFLAL